MIEPIIFLGPPGTGKTETLLNTVELEMERGVPPDRIGFMTFTRHGVEEAISRAAKKFNQPRSKFRYFNTFHSAAFRHLGLNTKDVFTGKLIQEFGREHQLELRGGMSWDDGTYNSNFYGDDLILFLENFARITRQPLDVILEKYQYQVPDFSRVLKVVSALKEWKAKNDLYDFTDMIERFLVEDDPPHLEVLIVDEAQDLSELQWEMVHLLSRHVKRIYIAGDDDQTIFTWAGASERFINMPGQVIVLGQSYRIPHKIHTFANRIINRIDNRRPKSWRARDAEGSLGILENITGLDPGILDPELGSVMMLGRTAKLLRQKFVPYCRMHGLLYKHFDSYSIKPTQAQAITAWIRLQTGLPIPAEEAVRIYDLLPSEGHKTKKGLVQRGFKAHLRRIAEQAYPPHLNLLELRNEYGLLAEGSWNEVFTEILPDDVRYIKRVLEQNYDIVQEPNIRISTIHRVKGGQANTVILLSDTAKVSDKMFTGNQDDETRVFYTGITRTYEDLVLIHPGQHHYFERLFD